MSAQDNLNGQQFMFHATHPRNRDSIAKIGLKVDNSLDEGDWKSVYMSQRPNRSDPGTDVWKVNVSGYRAHIDGNSGEDETEVGKSYYVDHDIPPDRLSLHHTNPGKAYGA